MSLSQRVTSLEDYDGYRSPSPASSTRRKLSFNPVQTWVPEQPDVVQAVGAFEVSKTKRILQVLTAVIYCLLAAGVVFGYAAIKPILISEGVYREYCTKEELHNPHLRVCYEQELRLNFMFTCAAVSTNVVALPVGTILDRYGPRVAGFIGVIFLTMGAFFFAFAFEMKPWDGYIPGYLFLALGGPFIFISSFQLSNTFPQYSGLILALLTGAFDTSSAIFLFYRLIYQATNGSFWPKKFFLIYLVVPAFILAAQTFLMPSQSYKTVGELVTEAEGGMEDDVHQSDDELAPQEAARVQADRRFRRESVISEITSLLGTKDAEVQTKKEEDKRHISGVWGALHGKTAGQQITSWWFVLITLFTVVQMTRINYFVATIRPQYSYMLDDDLAAEVNTFFDVALPLGGVISVPFIGLILDNTSTPLVLSILVTVASAIGVLGMIPSPWAAYANICLFVVYRPFYYTAVSDYSAKVFGFATFGKVYGLIICLAGLFNFSQSMLDAATHKIFEDDPAPVNLFLLILALIIGITLVIYVYRKSLKLSHEMLNQEAMAAQETERLMPGADLDGIRESDEYEGTGFGRVDYGTTSGRSQ